MRTDKAIEFRYDGVWVDYELDSREHLIGYQAIVNSAEVLVGLRFITKIF